MNQNNGTPTGAVVVAPRTSEDTDRYRPKASTGKVREEIERSLSDIISESAYQAANFASLVFYDRDKENAVRYQHLVDASHCLELALTYITQLKNELVHRMTVDESNDSTEPWSVPPGPPGFSS